MAGALQTVQCWHPHDFAFTSTTEYSNPFAVPFSGKLVGPNVERFEQLGFHVGNGTWVLRVSVPSTGTWCITTCSEDPDLHGRHLCFHCVANEDRACHGGIRVDPKHTHHFICQDGTHPFLLGYECDWLWALDLGSEWFPTGDAFLDKLSNFGFNHVVLNAYAHDTSWSPGNKKPHDLGPPPLFPWEGTNKKPDHSQFNLAFWRHYDYVIQTLFEHSMFAHIMIKVYNKKVNWPEPGTPEDDLYFKWLIARYAAYPNVIWDFSKEAYNEESLDYKRSRFQLIRENDPYRRPITSHDDNAYDDPSYQELVDFMSDQNHENWHAVAVRQRETHCWPVVNIEFGYEHGPQGIDDKTYKVVQSPEEVCHRAWEVTMAGAYPVYYYTYTAWDVLRTEDQPPGYTLMWNLKQFFEEIPFHLLEPSDALVSEGHCLAHLGKTYVVYLREAKPFEIDLSAVSNEAALRWYRPLQGDWIEACPVQPGQANLTPPKGSKGHPLACLIQAAG